MSRRTHGENIKYLYFENINVKDYLQRNSENKTLMFNFMIFLFLDVFMLIRFFKLLYKKFKIVIN